MLRPILASALLSTLLLVAASTLGQFDAWELAVVAVILVLPGFVLQLFTLNKLFQIQKESTAVAALHQVADLGKRFHELHERVDGHSKRLGELEESARSALARLGGFTSLERAVHAEQAETRKALASLQKEMAVIAQQAGLIPGV